MAARALHPPAGALPAREAAPAQLPVSVKSSVYIRTRPQSGARHIRPSTPRNTRQPTNTHPNREVSLKPGEKGAKAQVVLPDPKGQTDRALRFLPTVASPDSTVARENAALLALLHVRTFVVACARCAPEIVFFSLSVDQPTYPIDHS